MERAKRSQESGDLTRFTVTNKAHLRSGDKEYRIEIKKAGGKSKKLEGKKYKAISEKCLRILQDEGSDRKSLKGVSIKKGAFTKKESAGLSKALGKAAAGKNWSVELKEVPRKGSMMDRLFGGIVKKFHKRQCNVMIKRADNIRGFRGESLRKLQELGSKDPELVQAASQFLKSVGSAQKNIIAEKEVSGEQDIEIGKQGDILVAQLRRAGADENVIREVQALQTSSVAHLSAVDFYLGDDFPIDNRDKFLLLQMLETEGFSTSCATFLNSCNTTRSKNRQMFYQGRLPPKSIGLEKQAQDLKALTQGHPRESELNGLLDRLAARSTSVRHLDPSLTEWVQSVKTEDLQAFNNELRTNEALRKEFVPFLETYGKAKGNQSPVKYDLQVLDNLVKSMSATDNKEVQKTLLQIVYGKELKQFDAQKDLIEQVEVFKGYTKAREAQRQELLGEGNRVLAEKTVKMNKKYLEDPNFPAKATKALKAYLDEKNSVKKYLAFSLECQSLFKEYFPEKTLGPEEGQQLVMSVLASADDLYEEYSKDMVDFGNNIPKFLQKHADAETGGPVSNYGWWAGASGVEL